MDQADKLCHAFVGERISKSNNVGQSITACRECQRPLCLLCGGRLEHSPTDDSHRCVPIDTDDAVFEGLKRGKDYQICPSERCGMKIELSEACNAMRCHCGTTFCYICGEPANEGSDHWTKKPNGCPKYHQPGAENARYDAPVHPPARPRFVTPPRRTLYDELFGGEDHGPEGIRFAGLRIPLWPAGEEQRFDFDNLRNRMRALRATRLYALGGERPNAIVDAIMDAAEDKDEDEDGNGDGHDQP